MNASSPATTSRWATSSSTGLDARPARGSAGRGQCSDIDANGIVHVSAKDKATGKEQSMTVTGGSALGKDDIDRMVKDAETHAEEDKKRREAVEMRNEADALAFRTGATTRRQRRDHRRRRQGTRRGGPGAKECPEGHRQR